MLVFEKRINHLIFLSSQSVRENALFIKGYLLPATTGIFLNNVIKPIGADSVRLECESGTFA
jgi:hypothetical protein